MWVVFCIVFVFKRFLRLKCEFIGLLLFDLVVFVEGLFIIFVVFFFFLRSWFKCIDEIGDCIREFKLLCCFFFGLEDCLVIMKRFMLFFMMEMMFCLSDNVFFCLFVSVNLLKDSLVKVVYFVLKVVINLLSISFNVFLLFLCYLKIMVKFGGFLK